VVVLKYHESESLKDATSFIVAVTNPVQDVVDFIQEYRAKYGNNHPTFYQVWDY